MKLCTQIAYNQRVKAVFVELPAFERYRSSYLDDAAFAELQRTLMRNPEAGEVIEGTGGLRVIYYWWSAGTQFWLYTLYSKDEMADLTATERKALRAMLKAELEARRSA